jgi:hypothetical protein
MQTQYVREAGMNDEQRHDWRVYPAQFSQGEVY